MQTTLVCHANGKLCTCGIENLKANTVEICPNQVAIDQPSSGGVEKNVQSKGKQRIAIRKLEYCKTLMFCKIKKLIKLQRAMTMKQINDAREKSGDFYH